MYHTIANRKQRPSVMIRGTDLYLFCERKAIAPNEAEDFENVFQVSYANGKERTKSTKFMVKILEEDDNFCHNKFAVIRETGTLFHLKEAEDELPEALKQTPAIDLCTKDIARDGQIYLAHLEVMMRNGISDQLFDQVVGDQISPAREASVGVVGDIPPVAAPDHVVPNNIPSAFSNACDNVARREVDDEFAIINRKTASKRKSLTEHVEKKKVKAIVNKQTRENAITQLEDLFKSHFPMADNAVKTAIVRIFQSYPFLFTRMSLFVSMMKGEVVDCIDIGEDLQSTNFWALLGNIHRVCHNQPRYGNKSHEVMVSKCTNERCHNTSHIFFLSIRNLSNMGNLLLVDGCLKAANGSLKMAEMIPDLLNTFNCFKRFKGWLPTFAYASREARSIIENYYRVGNFDDCLEVDAMTLDDSENLLLYLHCVYAHKMNLPQSFRHSSLKVHRVKYFMSCGKSQCISPSHVRCIDCGENVADLKLCMTKRTEQYTKRRQDIYERLIKATDEEASTDQRLVKLYETFSGIASLSSPRQTYLPYMMRLSRNTLDTMMECTDEVTMALFFDNNNMDCIHNNKIVEILVVAFQLAKFGLMDSTRRLILKSHIYQFNRVQLCQTLHHCCNFNHLKYLGYKRVAISDEAWNLLPWLLEDVNTVPIDNTVEISKSESKTPDEMVEEILLDETIPETIRSNIDVFKQCLEAAYQVNTKKPEQKTYAPDEKTINEHSSELALAWLAKHDHMKSVLHLIEKSNEIENFNVVQNDIRDLFSLTQSLILQSDKASKTHLPEWRKFCGSAPLSYDELKRRYLIEAEIIIAAHTTRFSASIGQRSKYSTCDSINQILNRFICFLVASEMTLASAKAEDLISNFTYFNCRSDGAESVHLRCLKLFQTIALAGQSDSPNTIPHSDQSQMLNESTVFKYSEIIITILTTIRIIPGTDTHWFAYAKKILGPIYKKHEKTKAIDILYPVMKPDLYIALDRIIEKKKLSPCDISDIVLLLLLVETGWRPTGIVPEIISQSEKTMKLRHLRFMRNFDGEHVLELKLMFSKTSKQHGLAETPRLVTAKKHKYCLVRWMMLYLRLRQVIELRADGDYVIVDDHKEEPVFVHHYSGMFFAHPMTQSMLTDVMISIANALKMPSNQIRAKSYRKGYAIQKAFTICNENRFTTMAEIERSLTSCPNWKTRECLAYLDFCDIKFTSILQQFLDARQLEATTKVEEFYSYAYEIGNHRDSTITPDHPVVTSLKTHFFHNVSLEQLAGFLNIFANILDTTLQRTRRQRNDNMDHPYVDLTLNTNEIIAHYPFLMAPEIFNAKLTGLRLDKRYCKDCKRFCNYMSKQHTNHTFWDKTIELAWTRVSTNSTDTK